jgi:hypothetical protein
MSVEDKDTLQETIPENNQAEQAKYKMKMTKDEKIKTQNRVPDPHGDHGVKCNIASL